MADVAIMWFRRDWPPRTTQRCSRPGMRLTMGTLFPSSVDPALWNPSGVPRKRFLIGCRTELNEAMDGHLVVRRGDPTTVLPELVVELRATSVHIAHGTGPYGRQRDQAVTAALAGTDPVSTGSASAVTPGRVRKPDGEPDRVFTPFAKAWRAHGWREPAISLARSPGCLTSAAIPCQRLRTTICPHPPRANERPTRRGRRFGRRTLPATRPSATGPIWIVQAGCPLTCTSDPSIPGPSSPMSLASPAKVRRLS